MTPPTIAPVWFFLEEVTVVGAASFGFDVGEGTEELSAEVEVDDVTVIDWTIPSRHVSLAPAETKNFCDWTAISSPLLWPGNDRRYIT